MAKTQSTLFRLPPEQSYPAASRRTTRARALCYTLLAAVAAYLICNVLWASCLPGRRPPKEHGGKIDFGDVRWAQYSPWRPVEEYRAPPEGCEVTQVNLLERHGARYPTTGAGLAIQSALLKMQAVAAYSDPKFAFIRDYVYNMEDAQLVKLGRMQARSHGVGDYARYKHLFGQDERRTPFVRAARSPRVIDSATNWTTGFSHGSKGKLNPVLSLIIDELPGVNNSLHNNLCPKSDLGDTTQSTFLDTFAPAIRARLAAAVDSSQPSLDLTNDDIPSLISLCPFDSVTKLTLSPWCSLFLPTEFASFEYFHDLGKYYGTGYGSPLGRVQGIAYVSELLARLTDSPVVDHTQTNSTLDADEKTFPLGRTFYADFSHDNEMAGIMSAMGLFRDSDALDPRRPARSRKWRNREMVPFSGRMVVERLACQSQVDSSSRKDSEVYVRVLVNDRVMPLESCEEAVEGERVYRLDSFVESQGYVRRGGDGEWEKCFEPQGGRL